MKIVNVTQGTPEWHALRADYFTASEAPAMAGASKYVSRQELMATKFTGMPAPVTQAQERIFAKGHAAEEAARPMAEEIVGDELYPVTTVSETYPKLLASLDGMTMDGSIIFEHKLWNESLAEAVRQGACALDPHYLTQMTQQLLVTGAEKCLFMVSDGTPERCVYCWFYPEPSLEQKLLAGWQQFEEDLAKFSPAGVVPKGAQAGEELPELELELTSEVHASNFPVVRSQALAVIEAINTELSTDQHFADAEQAVKYLKAGEEKLKAGKKAALAKTASLSELLESIDELAETMRSKRLELDRLVKARKEELRIQVIEQANAELNDYVQSLGKTDARLTPSVTMSVAHAIKGKRNLEKIKEAAAEAVAEAKVAARIESERLADNLKLLEGYQRPELFERDDHRLIALRAGQMVDEIEHRIAQEDQRIAEERARIARKAAETEADQAAPGPMSVEEDESLAREFEDEVLGSKVDAPLPSEYVTIPRAEYSRLVDAKARLDALEAAGVDNWIGYDDAMSMLEEEATA